MQKPGLINVANVFLIFAGFALLYLIFDPASLTILVNSTFFGAMFSIAVAYGKLGWYSFLGRNEIDPRTRQYALTVIGQWIVISIGVSTSIWLRIADYSQTAYVSISFARYLATCIAIIQVMTPDYGYGIFYGRDRKFLIAGMIGGVLVAMTLIFLQEPTGLTVVPLAG